MFSNSFDEFGGYISQLIILASNECNSSHWRVYISTRSKPCLFFPKVFDKKSCCIFVNSSIDFHFPFEESLWTQNFISWRKINQLPIGLLNIKSISLLTPFIQKDESTEDTRNGKKSHSKEVDVLLTFITPLNFFIKYILIFIFQDRHFT